MTELQEIFISLLRHIGKRYESGQRVSVVNHSLIFYRSRNGGLPPDWITQNILLWSRFPSLVLKDTDAACCAATYYCLLADALESGDIEWPTNIPSLSAQRVGTSHSTPARTQFLELLRYAADSIISKRFQYAALRRTLQDLPRPWDFNEDVIVWWADCCDAGPYSTAYFLDKSVSEDRATYYCLLADALESGDIDWPDIRSLNNPVEQKMIHTSRTAFIALARAVNKWQRIADGDDGESAIPCPLCQKYLSNSSIQCANCPVYKDTGIQLCRGTPYHYRWMPALRDRSKDLGQSLDFVADNPFLFDQRMKDAANAEWKYLQDLCTRTQFEAD